VNDRFLRTEGIVLGTVKFGEGHSIIRLLTERHGRIDGSAFGSRKTRSRFGSSLDPFNINLFLLYKNKPGSPYRISEAEIVLHNGEIRQNLDRILIANGLVEPVILFIGDEEREKGVYVLLRDALSLLGKMEPETAVHLHSMYDLKLLELMGYGTQDSCVRCGSAVENASLFRDPGYGFPVCKACITHDSELVQEGAGRFIRWAMDSPLHQARKVRMERNTYVSVRETIASIYGAAFGRVPQSWEQIEKLVPYSRNMERS